MTAAPVWPHPLPLRGMGSRSPSKMERGRGEAELQGGGRWRERGLLLLVALFCLGAAALLSLVWERPLSDARFRPLYSFVVVLVVGHGALSARRSKGDQLLLPLAAALSGVGMVLVTRLVPGLAMRQLVWAVIGMSVMLAVALGPWHTRLLERYKYTSAVAGLALVALTLVFGIDPNGSGQRLWLGTRALSFQPSEALKVLLVVFLAGYLVDKRELLAGSRFHWGRLTLPPLPYLAPMMVMWGLSMALFIGQKDLGVALIVFAVFLAVLYAAIGKGWYVVVGFLLFLAGSAFCYLLFAHVRLRVEIWLNPWVDAQGRSYQVAQALYSLASGGLFGDGLGQGYPLYVPAAHTDFPFVAWSEELGLAAALALLLLYALLVTRGLEVALRSQFPFERLLATGLTSVLAVQTFVIVAGNLKLIPLTGVTLPFVSYGGSSLLANFFILGLLLRISHDSANGRT